MMFGRKRHKTESVTDRISAYGASDNHEAETKERVEVAKGDPYISFANGNRNDPVVVLGDDPSNGTEGLEKQDNILIVPLGRAISVARDSVNDEETAPDED